MIGVKLDSFINDRFGKNIAGRQVAAKKLGTTVPTLYRWMSAGNFFVYEEGDSFVIMELNKKAEISIEVV